ncbi:hypothetical protein GCM10010377_70840 [Streptomyces viridiviolaceus]|uniref:YbjN domain-containing protein n=1 Tax=Streptomyces viridiviolaceus TaxID=68282 RepID=A0ABW2E9B9_9ACTN|nr:hypothetical protein [Streptomyces viridiviolaceus]GHB69955.1 hypothetical protein GCM10010377_70840 [Streptomyces viridiviolaceus]
MTEAAPRPPASAELEAALRSLGVADPAPHERWDSDGWVADWDGDVHGHDVYVLVMGARNHPESARLMLDDFTFEDVRTEHVGELVRKAFTGGARVTRRRVLLARQLVLEVRAGSAEYSASVGGDSVEDLSTWARPLATP